MSQLNGRISQIIGPVIDVYFDVKGEDSEKVLPKIYDALREMCIRDSCKILLMHCCSIVRGWLK